MFSRPRLRTATSASASASVTTFNEAANAMQTPANIRPMSGRLRRFLANIPITVSIFFAVLVIVQYSAELFEDPIPTGPPWHGPPFLLPNDIARLLGPYSPWYPAEYYEAPPAGCNITQAHFLIRHGARFPTKSQGEKIKEALSHINPPPRGYPSPLGFMRKYKYNLKTDELLWFGSNEAYAAGVAGYNRYSQLAHIAPPFSRTGNSSRVVDTAKSWKSGFEVASRMRLTKALLISEEPGTNNTLKDNQCPAHSQQPAYNAQATWLSIFAPNITQRLNSDAPGSKLVDEDIPKLMDLCSFESLYHFKTSEWCGIFTLDEWNDFEYYTDLEKFYNTGPGNPHGRPQGIGWINELIARLTLSPVNDTTQTNHTLDSNPATFPLENTTMWADFTHDNEMNAVLAAMGVLRMADTAELHEEDPKDSPNLDEGKTEQDTRIQTPLSPSNARRKRAREMDPTHPDPNRKWVASRLVPFAARLVIEKLSCPSSLLSSTARYAPSANETAVEAVRMLLNDAVLHVPSCLEKLGKGVCTLEEFLDSQVYSRNGGMGEWETCRV